MQEETSTLPSSDGRTKIGIVGVGVVGGAMRNYFEQQEAPLGLYDPYKQLGSEREINDTDVVFMCVPTPYHPTNGFDASALEAAVSLLEGSKVVVIKSTVLPGTTEAFQSRYPQHCFLFNPEFLHGVSAREDFVNTDRQIVGYTAQSRHLAEAVLSLLPEAPFMRTVGAREAEMAKYMTNTFLAIKVIFANEIYDLCSALDVDYDEVSAAVAADERIGPSHLNVMDAGYRGYGGKRLPKDTKALIDLAERLEVPFRLVRTAERVNATLLPPADGPPPTRVVPITPNGEAEKRDERVA